MKKIAVLGSTGSIGQNTLSVLQRYPEKFRAYALAAGHNIEILSQQIDRFRPQCVSVGSDLLAQEVRRSFPGLEVVHGSEGLRQIVTDPEVEIVVSGIVGFAGVAPILEAIAAKKTVALANKEALVVAGKLIKRLVKENNATFIPLDSEHNALFQLLRHPRQCLSVRRAILTASGGPFWNWESHQLEKVSVEQAVAHPKWKMGKKISVDSATLMNKGLELIEAHHLFDFQKSQLQVVIHPQCYVHGMLEFEQGTFLCYVSPPDMKYPIQYALHFPESAPIETPEIPLPLEFYSPSLKRFPCLKLALDVLGEADSYSVALNAANEVVVTQFLEGALPFTKIPIVIEEVLQKVESLDMRSFEEIVDLDSRVRS